MNPPRGSEWLLRLVLSARDRDTVSGDLLEEYRETIVPARGDAAARRWYRRQVAGIVWRSTRTPIVAGVLLGAVLGGGILVDTARHPLADDDAAVMLAWFAAILGAWTAASAAIAWRTRRFGQAIAAGVLLGAATMLVFHVAAIARVVVFVDTIRARDDWQELVGRYQASGFHTL